MRIGELASATGVSVRALRHYEAQGLIRSERNPNGYRDFPPLAIEQIRQIRLLLECGFSTRQIRGFLPCFEPQSFDPEACAAGVAQHLAKLRQIDRLIDTLQQRRQRLSQRLALLGISSFDDKTESENTL